MSTAPLSTQSYINTVWLSLLILSSPCTTADAPVFPRESLDGEIVLFNSGSYTPMHAILHGRIIALCAYKWQS